MQGIKKVIFHYCLGKDVRKFSENFTAIANHINVIFKYDTRDATNTMRAIKEPAYLKFVALKSRGAPLAITRFYRD